MVLESNRAMFESNLRCEIESRFDFAHHWDVEPTGSDVQSTSLLTEYQVSLGWMPFPPPNLFQSRCKHYRHEFLFELYLKVDA